MCAHLRGGGGNSLSALSDPILRVDALTVDFGVGNRSVRAVDDVSFVVPPHGCLTILGESGSGKTSVALALAGLLPKASAAVTGQIVFAGRDLLTLKAAQMQEVRGRELGMVFQDPLSSLNPVKSVGQQVAELFSRHQGMSKKQSLAAAVETLELVQIPHAAQRAGDFPHQFSGGMRQRVMIAIAVALKPRLVIADEPTTALDVTVQAQILDLLGDLRAEVGTALIVISHDLGVAAALPDQLAIMYAGRFVETGTLDDIYENACHPYTRGLLASAPQLDGARLVPIAGSPPRIGDLPTGCAFHPRCPYAQERCRTERPLLRVVGPGRLAACHYAEEFMSHDASLPSAHAPFGK
jgi:oligopeptide transport system ATP-binding protein